MKAPITDRPILFSAPMVRALLEGTKTQTRRVVKPQPPSNCVRPMAYEGTWTWEYLRHGVYLGPDCPYGVPGDTLWVRETHALVPRTAYAQSEGVQQTTNPTDHDQAAVYREGWERSAPGKWRPSIHMPRWASRISLRVTSLRVERVQDISEEDARAEGVQRMGATQLRMYGEGSRAGRAWVRYTNTPTPWCDSARESFASLWCCINGRESWDANPWVWCVGFERVESAVLAQLGGVR